MHAVATEMQYRRFGRTGLQMPVFSCGGMRYQYKWQDVPPSEVLSFLTTSHPEGLKASLSGWPKASLPR